MLKHFKVKARGGHVGAGNDIELTFYVEAKDILSAMKKVRNMPAVKHDKGNAILSALPISEEEYSEGIVTRSAYDAYNNRENI